jgi:hypothetical protein
VGSWLRTNASGDRKYRPPAFNLEELSHAGVGLFKKLGFHSVNHVRANIVGERLQIIQRIV